MCNDSELNQQDTKYIIETNDKKERDLLLKKYFPNNEIMYVV